MGGKSYDRKVRESSESVRQKMAGQCRARKMAGELYRCQNGRRVYGSSMAGECREEYVREYKSYERRVERISGRRVIDR